MSERGGYRLERAATGRAVCKDKVCKENGVKIQKGELRVGIWVTIHEHGGYQWKHWGCVSGKQLENMRNLVAFDISDPDTYRFDMLDGFDDEMEKDPLSEEQKEKIKKALIQGFIDPEDFNGDPEKNVLGATGIHLTDKQKATKAAAEEKDANGEDAPKKRSRKNAADGSDDDAEDSKPAKKQRTKKAAQGDDGIEEAKPARKPRAKKAVKQEVKDEDEDEAFQEAAPAKKGRGKKAVKQEIKDEDEEAALEDAPPAKKGRGKKAVKQEVKDEDDDDEAPVQPAKRGRKAKAQMDGAAEEELPEAAPKKRGGRPKKATSAA